MIPTASLKSLVTTAFDVSYWQLSGGEKWMEEDTYDVEAKPPESAEIKDFRYTLFSISDVRLRLMLQDLLTDRFQLKFHRETRTGDVYVLKQSGKALRLKATEMSSPDPYTQGAHAFGSIGYVDGGWGLFSTTMGQLAKFASDNQLHAPVLDQTDLAGIFDYRQAVPDDEPAYTGAAHTQSFMRMIEVVGLKLEKSKGPVETLVIDHAERPTPN